MKGASPSSVDDNDFLSRLCDELDVDNNDFLSTLRDELDVHTFMPEFSPSPQTMTTMGHLDGTSSSRINQNGPTGPQIPSSEQQGADELPMSNQVPGMPPQPPMNQCSRQFLNQVSTIPNPYDPRCPTMLPEPSQTMRQEEEEAAPRIQVSKITSSNSLHKEPLIKMTRPNVRFRDYVVKLHDDREKCILCGHIFAKRTSTTRIRHHLSGETGKGVEPCVGEIPEEIKEAALGRDGSSHMPPGEDLASGLADQRLEDTASLSDETRGDPFPISSTMLVGRAFEENTKKIWSWIMDDKVSTIGIYGMAGVGKTELLKHVHNDLLQSQNSTHRLYWVHVSQNSSNENSSKENFSIERLQNLIAKRIGLDLSSEDDDQSRAIKLSKELLRLNQRWILFLDDLWDDCLNDFELDIVGIPETIKGCKLIVSTRSQDVCRTVANRYTIKVDTLSDEEVVSLFMKKLGHNIENYPEKRRIAGCVVNKCGGLPLAIKAMARSMRRFRFDRQWREALKYLEESSAGQSHMKREFRTLKSSYTHLKKYDQKEGFLYCALFPKAFMIPRDDLIAYLIDEGVIEKQESREAEFRRGHGLLDRLEGVCLLESIDGGSAVKMHDLIRNVAIEIYQERGRVIIKAGENLKNLSGARKWEESLLTASLIENQIKEIRSTDSPKCPELSTLLLHYNRGLELIDDTFFNQLYRLKILDLSHTVIEKLPNSVSNLVWLTTLLLIDCKKLVHVPSLEKLREMRRLDLYRTALENIPQGLECLSELRYLRMSSCGQKNFPGWVLHKLSHLQVFILGWEKNAPMTVKGEELGCLEQLEDLECHFNGHSDLVAFFKYWDQTDSLQTCKVRVGQFEENDCYNVQMCYRDKAVGFDDLRNKYGDFQVIFSNENKELIIRERSIMESFVSSSRFRSSPLLMPSNNGKFSCLKEFYCVGCKSMKKLFPLVFLKNLEVIEVSNCEKMVEIIETESDDEGLIDEESSRSNSTTDLKLPKLKTLKLIKLPELKSIFSAKLICNSLEVIHIKNCEKLKRITISLPFLESNERIIEIIIYPEEWWVSALEWGHKDALRRFVKFQGDDCR